MLMRDKVGELDSPKHGKMDPTGAPHVGGNTWAGGTGGRDTAGKRCYLTGYICLETSKNKFPLSLYLPPY